MGSANSVKKWPYEQPIGYSNFFFSFFFLNYYIRFENTKECRLSYKAFSNDHYSFLAITHVLFYYIPFFLSLFLKITLLITILIQHGLKKECGFEYTICVGERQIEHKQIGTQYID